MKNTKLDVQYCFIHIIYWLVYATLISFASVYLVDKGLSNSVIGFVLAGGNILALILQSVVATYMDRNPNNSLKNYLAILFVVSFFLSALLYFIPLPNVVVCLIIVLQFMTYQSAPPLLSSMAMRLTRDNIDINFGLARGLGSFVYAIACIILGQMIVLFGSGKLKLYEAVIYVFLTIVVFTFRDPRTKIEVSSVDTRKKSGDTSYAGMFRRYPKFSWFAVSSILVFMAHSFTAYFMYQVISAIGGNSSSQGTSCAIGAFAESIVTMLFVKLNDKASINKLLKISILMFAVKQIVTMVAWNVPSFYFSQFLQFGGYGIWLPGSVIFTKRLMRGDDLVKGTTMIAMAPIIGNVIASFLGGLILDGLGVRGLTSIATACSVTGAVLMLIIINSKELQVD